MRVLCLHTLRADCNAPLTPLRVALPCFASTRSVQIATFPFSPAVRCWFLCLHTLRADCNLRHFLHVAGVQALPPHAPCRLQPRGLSFRPRRLHSLPPHAPCRLQPSSTRRTCANTGLCLHTLRADCNPMPAAICSPLSCFASTRSVQIATVITRLMPYSVESFASTRSVQIATAEMHRIAIYTFFERVLSW